MLSAVFQPSTVGASYDDAGIGALNQRHVVLWGYTWQYPSGLAPWYGQYLHRHDDPVRRLLSVIRRAHVGTELVTDAEPQ